jgi:Family of unknown function (DUF6868)
MEFLLAWMFFFTLIYVWMYQFHSRWFSSFSEQYAGMGDLQDGIILLNLVPYIWPRNNMRELNQTGKLRLAVIPLNRNLKTASKIGSWTIRELIYRRPGHRT